MTEINVGTVTIILPEGMTLDPRAGKLTKAEKYGVPKARKGLGLACDQTAAAMEKANGALVVPNVTAGGLRQKGALAENIDQVIEDTKIALEIMRQANLLADADAFTELRKVNQQVKAQSQFNPSLKDRFAAVIDYFSNKKRAKAVG